MSEDTGKFEFRFGGRIFNCKFCGTERLQWAEIRPEVWRPYEIGNSQLHDCTASEFEKLNQEDVLQHLQNMGFETYVPRTTSWKFAFTAHNATQSLYFLIGSRSIDFKFYEAIKPIVLDEKGKLYTDGGGMLVRNYYKGSEVNVHRLVLELASRFLQNAPIEKRYLTGHGKTWYEQKAEYVRNLPKETALETRNEMREIYNAISLGDGEDAYLGDGIWLNSSGSSDDRGR